MDSIFDWLASYRLQAETPTAFHMALVSHLDTGTSVSKAQYDLVFISLRICDSDDVGITVRELRICCRRGSCHAVQLLRRGSGKWNKLAQRKFLRCGGVTF
jgi:hypothetical protein